VSLAILPPTRGQAALLTWRIGAFLLGAVLGLAGIFLNASWLVIVSLVVLLAGVLLCRAGSAGDE